MQLRASILRTSSFHNNFEISRKTCIYMLCTYTLILLSRQCFAIHCKLFIFLFITLKRNKKINKISYKICILKFLKFYSKPSVTCLLKFVFVLFSFFFFFLQNVASQRYLRIKVVIYDIFTLSSNLIIRDWGILLCYVLCFKYLRIR